MSAFRHGLARHGRGDLGPGATKGSEPSEDVAPLTVFHCSRNVRPEGPSIADIGRRLSDVRFGPLADIAREALAVSVSVANAGLIDSGAKHIR
jgi:hypothetical protein